MSSHWRNYSVCILSQNAWLFCGRLTVLLVLICIIGERMKEESPAFLGIKKSSTDRERERETKQCKHSWRQPLLAYLRVPQTLFTYSPARPPILSCWLVNLFQVLCCSHCLTTSARIVLYTTTLFICWSQLEDKLMLKDLIFNSYYVKNKSLIMIVLNNSFLFSCFKRNGGRFQFKRTEHFSWGGILIRKN